MEVVTLLKKGFFASFSHDRFKQKKRLVAFDDKVKKGMKVYFQKNGDGYMVVFILSFSFSSSMQMQVIQKRRRKDII